MEELKTKRISIDLTDDEYARLRDFAECHNITVNRLLSQFIADLIVSDRSGGSDERCLASEWFDRSIYNF